MSFEVIFKEEADRDIFEACQWYESHRIGLGDELLDEIDEYVRLLEQDPQMYQLRKHNWRYCALKRFPYVIVFEMEKKEVIVYAVFNTHQHPYRLDVRNTKK